MTKKNLKHSTNPSLTDQRLGKLIIDYCRSKNDGDHANAEQILFEIQKIRKQHQETNES